MVETGPAWGAGVYADARWADARVTFRLEDTTAAGEAVPVCSGEAPISQLGQTHDGVEAIEKRWAVLERNYWALDGTFEPPKADLSGEETGWWSGVLSGEDGRFEETPSLAFDFTLPHSSVGFTIHFDEAAGEWATDFDLMTYDAEGNRLSLEEVRGNSGPVYVSSVPSYGYRRLELVFRRTSRPFRRVRVAEVVFGVVQSFRKDNTVDLKLLYEIDPRMDSLPVGELVITIDNRDRMYNMVNPTGAYRYLQQGQALNTVLGVGAKRDVELVNMGRHYFYRSSASDSGMTAQITARDRLFLLDRGTYRKGREGTDTVSTIVADILADSGTGLTAEIDPAVGNTVIGWAVPLVSHREALRLVAQAAMAVCFMGRDDVLHFVDLQEGETVDALDMNNMEEPPDVEVAERVNTVEVCAYGLQAPTGTQAGEVYKGTVELKGETVLWAKFSGPVRGAAATVSGGTLTSAEYYLYAAKLTMTGNGTATVVVAGVSLDASESVCVVQALEPGETEQAVEIENPLVCSDALARQVGERRLALEQRRLVYPIRERGNPAREVGDTVRVSDAYGEDRKAIILKEEFSFDGGLSADTKAWGGGD